MNNDGSGPKISFVSKIIMFAMVASADLFEGSSLVAGATGVGIVFTAAAWIYGFVISTAVTFWLFMLGANIKWAVPGFLFELIPILSALPTRTAAILITFAKDEAETIIKVAGTVDKIGLTKKADKRPQNESLL